MLDAIKMTLPYPPTVNHYWTVGRGRIYISPEGRAYRRQVKAILAGVPRIDGPVDVAIVACPPDRRRRDLDNLLKCLLDSLGSSGVFVDDSLIQRLLVVWGPRVTQGCVECGIQPSASAEAGGGEA